MDKMIHTALNSIKNLRDVRQTTAQNLSSVAIPGYRKDLPNDGGSAFVQELNKSTARAFNLEEGKAGFSSEQGALIENGVETDVAIVSEGYFFAKPPMGEISLTRRGDLSLNGEGFLVNGGGELMLNDKLEPIELPTFAEIQISTIGEISVSPIDGPPGQFQAFGMLGTTTAIGEKLSKGMDGKIRLAQGGVPAPDQGAKIVQGMLESANVDAVEELIQSLEAQRQFELGVKFIKMAEDIDRGGAELMRLPQN